ncbi:MAG: [protein-PII] uridylyltransferase [Acidiferrobacterales bacterium]
MPINKDQVLNTRDFERALESADDSLALFRTTLATGRKALKQRHIEHVAAQHIVPTQAWLIDELLIEAWKFHLALSLVEDKIALVAVGGYGRRELHPASDIDLLLLVEREDHNQISGFVEAFVRFLWDMGLEVGHSVRSLKDCVRMAKKDITVTTNLMEARLLYGSPKLFQKMKTMTAPPRIWPSRKFFAAKWQEQIERHHRFDDTAYKLEPNIKEGPGGLRDIQMIVWVTQRHFGASSLHDLVELGFLREEEYRALIRGRNFLWQLRNGLHYLAGRREDRLLFDHQRVLAQQLGYTDRAGSLAVEQFMKRYYRTVKELSLLNEILLQHFQEAILSRGKSRIKPINRRFRSHNNFIEVTHEKTFERAPYAILELFLIMQQQPALKGVRADTIRLLRANLHRIDRSFRKDLGCRSLFMEIMRQPQGITHALRRMNAYGVLGAYIPAFGRIVGQMQHDLFHVYTVDEHLLFVVRNLRRLTIPEHHHEFPLASSIIQHIVKPERLYLAALFHDIAKGRGGDHSVMGEKVVVAFCRRHGLSDYDANFVRWLVRHHLVMSWTAQRHDIHDPEVVLEFARQVGNQERLDNLYLLTVADIRGTSPKVWNAWKGRLLSELYSAATRIFRRGFATPLDLKAQTSELRNEALSILQPKDLSQGLVENYWRQLDDVYFLRYGAESLAWHAETIASASAADFPIVATRYNPEIGGSEFLIYTPDREYLFVVQTAGFDRMNLSIVDARIHTTRNGFALNTFVVLDYSGEAVRDPKVLADLRQRMREQLLSPRQGRDARTAHLSRQLKHFPIETKVNFSSSVNGQQTIMEVIAQDRPGLLYQVALTLQHCRVNLVTAKVSTYGERAEDIFFITDLEKRPLTDRQQLACLERETYERLEGRAANATGELRAISSKLQVASSKKIN